MTPGTGVRRRLVACTLAALVLAVGALGLAIGASTASAQTNLVKDGDFESPPAGSYVAYDAGRKIGPWTVGTGNVDHHGTVVQAAKGKQSMDLNGRSGGSIFQDLATVPGEVYRLRFAMAGNPAGGAKLVTLGIRWGGVQVARKSFNTQGHSTQSMGWSYRAYVVRATSRKTRLEFTSLTPEGPYGPTIDDVSVTGRAGEPPPPVAGKSVVARVTSGTVFIKLPAGKRIRRGKGKKSAFASASRFRRYKGKANIPVGSTIDTRKGRIAITAAADLKGATQDATFYAGIFQIKQKRSTKPVTDAELVTSRRACSSKSGRASASKKRLGRLWASGKGRFRTKTRYSAASVRGTTWLTEERCDGTFTKVSRGRVAVRDKRLGKTILLTAGQSYLARAQRASNRG